MADDEMVAWLSATLDAMEREAQALDAVRRSLRNELEGLDDCMAGDHAVEGERLRDLRARTRDSLMILDGVTQAQALAAQQEEGIVAMIGRLGVPAVHEDGDPRSALSMVEDLIGGVVVSTARGSAGTEITHADVGDVPPESIGRSAADDDDQAILTFCDPRAVLARVEAERAVTALHRSEERGRVTGPGVTEFRDVCDECTEWGSNDSVAYPCRTVRLLAFGHRFDVPGYRDEWAPDA